MHTTIASIRALLERLEQSFAMRDFVLLWTRTWIAKIFYLSGRTKAGDSFFSPSDLAVSLFDDEYDLPFIDPEFAAQMALLAETFFPIMLLLGLGSRFGAAGLLGMTLVIQIFVSPASFPDHATWAAAALMVLFMGPGKLSLDHLFFRNLGIR